MGKGGMVGCGVGVKPGLKAITNQQPNWEYLLNNITHEPIMEPTGGKGTTNVWWGKGVIYGKVGKWGKVVNKGNQMWVGGGNGNNAWNNK